MTFKTKLMGAVQPVAMLAGRTEASRGQATVVRSPWPTSWNGRCRSSSPKLNRHV